MIKLSLQTVVDKINQTLTDGTGLPYIRNLSGSLLIKNRIDIVYQKEQNSCPPPSAG
ncbi:hypothetical protein [Mucilaginibacter corticis]|uniref:hypothetical protein n=1 Tax=Mucilaginibacter corticis TaxID=2597670 RepID=UPI0016435E86|nr:hypothetical protein [Mucilaginibacter corticis]